MEQFETETPLKREIDMILSFLNAPMLAIGEIHERHDDIAENGQRLVDGTGLLQLCAGGLMASNR
jgi:hypothetical protein